MFMSIMSSMKSLTRIMILTIDILTKDMRLSSGPISDMSGHSLFCGLPVSRSRQIVLICKVLLKLMRSKPGKLRGFLSIQFKGPQSHSTCINHGHTEGVSFEFRFHTLRGIQKLCKPMLNVCFGESTHRYTH